MIRKILLVFFLLLAYSITWAQVVKGKVTSATDGGGLPGVTITVQGTKTGTFTAGDGTFSIKAANNAVLVFSFIGFKSQNVTVNSRSLIDVALEEDLTSLNDVVVTALGVTKEEKALGYATATINAKELTLVSSPSLGTTLYGKAPGVRISSAPGGSTSAVNIVVRGINSITGRNQPLLVMDGVPIRDGEVSNNNYWQDQRLRGNGLNDLNPDDIESISILKGASAAALYGSQAVNGVILVTSKKGRKGMNVDLNASYTVDKIAYTPRYQNIRGAGAPLNVANLGQNADGFVMVDMNGDGIKETRELANATINFGPKFDGQPILSWDGKMRPYSPQPNNYDALFQKALSSKINLAISTGSEKANMRLSLTRQDNGAISLNSKAIKNIANLSANYTFTKWLSTSININYINQDIKNRPFSIDRLINNFGGMMGRFDNGDWYRDKYETSLGYKYVTGTNQSLTPSENIIYNGFRGDIADYMWNVSKNTSEEKSNRVLANLTNTFRITDEISLRARVATDFTSVNIQDKQYNTRPVAFGPSGYFGNTNQLYNVLYGDLLLTYNKKLTKDITLTLMGGYTANKETSNIVWAGTNTGLVPENRFDLTSSLGLANTSVTRTAKVIDALLGTANFNYKNFWFVEGTLRRDRTSTMFPTNNSFTYPSINSSLVFSQAWDMPKYISYGKIRASWGIVGNYPDPYLANIAYNMNNLGSSILYTTVPTVFGNDKIRPEKKHEFEIGLETKFFKNRFGVDITYYNGKIVDQILPLTLPNSSGATSVLTNIGIMSNKGLEIGLNYVPIRTHNFTWETILNFAWNQNKILQLANGATELLHTNYDGDAALLKSIVGQPMGDFFAHPIETNASGQKIVNPDGLYNIDPKNYIKVGNTQPKGVGGILNNFSYKNFTLNANIDYRIGGYVMPTGINWMTSRGLTQESTKYMDAASGGLAYYVDKNGKGIATTATAGPNGEVVYHDGMLMDGVTSDGSKNTNIISQAYYYWNTYNWGGPQYSSSRYELYIQNASYVKMREISVGYTFPSKIAKNIKASRINVSVYGRNLFFLFRYMKDLDPETLTAGSRWQQTVSNAGGNPSTRSYGVMLRASF